MPSFRTATVTQVLQQRPDLTRVAVDVHDGVPHRAYAVTALVGPVAVGDEVVVNTTAVELGLGTGGWHIVHWNLTRGPFSERGPGHIMKLRYTSLQADTGAAEELSADRLSEADGLAGMPVVVGGLHSQLPSVVVALRHAQPTARIAYVMTDGAALPLALSELVPAMAGAGLLAGTVTAGHAFGGDHEAVNVPSALVVAKQLLGADVTVVTMGPGSVGTATSLGFSALEVAPALDAAESLGARPVAVCRFSLGDARPRHQGVSHHLLTALSLTHARASVGVPGGPFAARVHADLAAGGLAERHDVVGVDDVEVGDLLAASGLTVTTMGRGVDEDPGAFALAAAAGTLAAQLL
ncbi:MAG: DUF3866 family protein [Acidimicrobiales bacterium]